MPTLGETENHTHVLATVRKRKGQSIKVFSPDSAFWITIFSSPHWRKETRSRQLGQLLIFPWICYPLSCRRKINAVSDWTYSSEVQSIRQKVGDRDSLCSLQTLPAAPLGLLADLVDFSDWVWKFCRVQRETASLGVTPEPSALTGKWDRGKTNWSEGKRLFFLLLFSFMPSPHLFCASSPITSNTAPELTDVSTTHACIVYAYL